MSEQVELSVVIPVFNDQEILGRVFPRLEQALAGIDYELVLVNDGSQDRSGEMIEEYCRKNPRARLIELSRNFGQYFAVSAGLSRARGRAVLTMDSDLQDPPELIPEMLKRWKAGYQVVQGARQSRTETGLRKLGVELFYKVFSWLSDYPVSVHGGFALMDRAVVDQLVSLPERHRYFPGLRSWVGFKQTELWYDRAERVGGTSKWSLRKLVDYAVDATLSFSSKPLRLTWLAGLSISALCFIYGLVLVALRLAGIGVVPGFTTLVVSLFFLSGVQLVSLGILGEYLGRIYDEVKQRPAFIIQREYPAPGPEEPA